MDGGVLAGGLCVGAAFSLPRFQSLMLLAAANRPPSIRNGQGDQFFFLRYGVGFSLTSREAGVDVGVQNAPDIRKRGWLGAQLAIPRESTAWPVLLWSWSLVLLCPE